MSLVIMVTGVLVHTFVFVLCMHFVRLLISMFFIVTRLMTMNFSS